jgi:hypothetical protein
MNEYNITSYFNDAFGIDTANHVNVAEVLSHIDELESNIDDVLEETYH